MILTMLSKDNVKQILESARSSEPDLWEKDLAFIAMYDTFEDKVMAYRCVYGEKKSAQTVEEYFASDKMQTLVKAAIPFGIGNEKGFSISREENQEELTKMLGEIRKAMDDKKLDTGTGLKMLMDIRVKLQDKFDMDESDDTHKHIIVVPQKHDIICPSTNRECSKMPSKEACMEYYNLVESKK